MTAGTAEVVLTTKLFTPKSRRDLVGRDRLFALLRRGLDVPLTLVEAPAGWGKSTLVGDWLRRDAIPAGWISLDPGDDDPKRFWRYVVLAALQAVAAGAGALRRLDAAGSDVQRDVVPTFVNELIAGDAPVVLALDDYHAVSAGPVHASLGGLLEHCPPQLHLLVLTRTTPALPLSRLRVRRDLVEVSA